MPIAEPGTDVVDQALPRLAPLLRMAVKQGSVISVKVQLRAGAHPDGRDALGRTALMMAAELGHSDVCAALLAAGADPDIRDPQGMDALSLAQAKGFTEIVLLLQPAHQEPSPVTHREFPLPVESTPSPEPPVLQEVGLDFIHDHPLDISAWEAEPEDGPPPENDGDALQAAAMAQTKLSAHVPEDRDEDWSDVEISLPEITELRALARRAAQVDEGPTIELLRAGLRLGWVHPEWVREAVPCLEDNPEEPTPTYLDNLIRVLYELEILIEEDRFEQEDLGEALKGAPPLMARQDEQAQEALEHLRLLNSWKAEPINHWWHALAKYAVLSRDEETNLARMMQDGGREGLLAILLSKEAMRELLSTAARLQTGKLYLDDIAERSDDQEDTSDFDDEEPVIEGEDIDDLLMAKRQQRLNKFVLALTKLDEAHERWRATPERSAAIMGDELDLLQNLSLSGEFIGRLQAIAANDAGSPEAQTKAILATERAVRAREKFILANLRLVSWIAKKYARWSYTDAIQEGCIGLMKAVEKFDPTYGYKFSTYGSWWIRQSITRARDDTSKTIRIPIHLLEKLRKLDRAIASQTALTGETPSHLCLAETLEMSAEAVRKLLRVPDEPLSLHDPEVKAETISDETVPTPEQGIIGKRLKRHVLEVLNTLDPRQRHVICMRFGLRGFDEHTLEEVGQKYGVTRERIRQIEAKALKKLRHPARAKTLRSFCE